MRLSDYAEELYNFFSTKCDKEILREKILCDLLCCSSSVQIPEVLKVQDSLYKKAKRYFTENGNNFIKIAILYSKNQIFAVDQSESKNLHNRYEGEFYDTCEMQDSGV